jgi:hypothetical protein
VEQQAINNYRGTIPAFFRRFIDDCLGVASCPKDELLDFINHMSTFHPALQYTHTISPTSISFLDITITIEPDCRRLSTSIFYKPTDSHSYLLYSSSHPQATKDSIPYSQFLRLRRICSNDEDFETQAEKMFTFFTARLYPEHLVTQALEKARTVSRDEALAPRTSKDKEERTVAVLPYHPHNLAVRNILLRNFSLLQQDPTLKAVFRQPPLIAFKRDQNLRDLLVRSAHRTTSSSSASTPGCKPCGSNKCKTCPYIDPSTTFKTPSGQFTVRSALSCKSTNIVYILTCTLCNMMYVGETGRSLNDRFTEHQRSMRLCYNDPVGQHFSGHLHSHTHARIAAVWQNPRGLVYRRFMESSLIARLDTRHPGGLNTKE